MFENYKSKLNYNNINSIKPKSGYSGHVPEYKFVYGITQYDHWNNQMSNLDNNNQKSNNEFIQKRNTIGNRLYFS